MQKKSQLTIVIKDKTGNNVELSVDKAKIDRMRLEQERLANEIYILDKKWSRKTGKP